MPPFLFISYKTTFNLFLLISLILQSQFCQQNNSKTQYKRMVYISTNCSQPPELRVADTLIVKLNSNFGAGKNWKINNDTLNIQGILFYRKETDNSNNQNDGGQSVISFTFIMTSKTNQILHFEYGRLWEKNFKPEKKCDIIISVK